MKKSLVSALTTAFVVGAASTTFAASNPFSDVPADHWAYDAVAKLAAEGVIEGYGDGTYAGSQAITRYEMAQMVAKAMAKGMNSAEIDKLAAEFADELNSLGVRVSALEKRIDNVKFSGEARYTARRTIKEDEANKTDNSMELRLKMAATVNKNWTVKSRFDYVINGKDSKDAGLNDVEYMYAQGQYGKMTIDLGKYEFIDTVTEGMLFDDAASGIQVAYAPTKEVTVTVMGGRANAKYFFDKDESTAADMWGGRVEYTGKKLYLGASYYDFSGADLKAFNGNQDNKAKIWAVGAGYRFDRNFRLYGNYAQNTKAENGDQKKAYVFQLDYKGADIAKRGSYGAHVAYRYLGDRVVLNNCTYDIAWRDMKGIELGVDYTLDKNVLLNLGYFNGDQIGNDKDAEVLYSRIHFFF